MSLSLQEFTNAGKSMLGRAQNREVLTITKIVVGSGSAVQPSDLLPLTALKVKEMDVVISAKVDYGNGTMLVEGSFRSDAAPHAFYLKECGIMAHIGAEADRLYSCANVFAGAADYVDPAAATIQSFKIKLIIDRVATGDVIVQIAERKRDRSEPRSRDGRRVSTGTRQETSSTSNVSFKARRWTSTKCPTR